ncbi:hypothetical protein Taro_052656 [Colocasia esculenta]|uniref:Uncharacterized protein n=1 Tax=Colocasia esculenta TaxID=4460 RepID=A0A843XJ00_COLES|nr:hypothetical protein [Colocasia esculenta]
MLLSWPGRPSQQGCRDLVSCRDSAIVASRFPIAIGSCHGGPDRHDVATVGVSACAPWQGVPLGPSGGNAAGCLPAFTDRRFLGLCLVCRRWPTTLSGGFRKGCCACLCLLGLSWLQASVLFLLVVATPVLFRPVLGT